MGGTSIQSEGMSKHWRWLLVLALGVCPAMGGRSLHSGDAYVRTEGARWTFGTSSMERVVALTDGKLVLESLKSKASGRELAGHEPGGGVFSLATGDASTRVSAGSEGWTLVGSTQTKLKQGELQLDITVRRGALEATKSYIVYPGFSVVREWATFRNSGANPLRLVEPSFLDLCIRPSNSPEHQDFHWMTGGENQPGSWVLKTEPLAAGKPRAFDSYEPFPIAPGTPQFPGDGINAKVLQNDRQIWPAAGWQYVPNATVRIPFEARAEVNAGDKLVFLVNMNGGIGYDTTAFDPTITYEDGEAHTASKEFSEEQGRAGWQYQYLENGKYVNLVFYAGPRQWRKEKDNATGTPFVGVGDQHPDVSQDAARVWTAPKAGRVRITGSACNTGNQGGAGSYGFRMGSSTYAPWNALYDRDTRDGLFIGWDYFGHWASTFARQEDGSVAIRFRVAGHKQTLAPGQAVTTPKAFTGLFRDDLDDAGNECLDWQYRYLWDYTREPWFPAIRMLGYWMNGTGWGQSGVGWTGGNPDMPSTFRKVFRVADLMQYVGADVYHRDWGWWDRAGDWNGPDFRTTISYLGKHDMGQLIYAFLYTVDPESRVAKQHPEWLIGGSTLDMSQPAVVEFMRKQLDGFAARWGDFEWRNDSTPTCPRDGDDTPLLGQDAGFREVMRGFLDAHPHCAFQAVNGGGNNAGYDYARYASTVSFSDGAVGVIRNYWASLLLPPDKTSDIPDIWNSDQYDKAIWRGLLCINFDMTGDTWDPAKLEGLRELVDIYHYLHQQGVVGRWGRVYRPMVAGDDPTMYFQRLSRDGGRGIIIPKRRAPGAVTIRPKGLQAGERYVVSFQESPRREERRGADLMAQGITIEQMLPGELVYLNLPLHPGSRLDKKPPTPPRSVTLRQAENMGYPGVEVAWKPGSDDNWVSCYEVFRDGAVVDKVAHGCFYFDHSAGADPAAAYAVRTVDGAGNVSKTTPAAGRAATRTAVIDDAPGGGVTYTGAWEHRSAMQPAYHGTISLCGQQGASAEVPFEGGRVLWFAKLGPDCGKAEVSVDGGPVEVVDTYSADHIWGVRVWEKQLPAGRHTLRVTVLGQRSPRATGAAVHLDGIRVERQ
jgi:hypothetical protein